MSSELDPKVDNIDDADTDDEGAVTVDIKPEKFTWKIENFTEVARACVPTGGKYYSDEWVSGGCRWRLLLFPNGNPTSHGGSIGRNLSLYLDVPDKDSLPAGWRRQARFWLNVVDQKDSSKTHKQETTVTLSTQTPDYGFPQLMPLATLKDPNLGFCVDDTIIVEAELVVQKVWTETHQMTHYSYNTRKDLGYVGLRNQGATCYLNSLMQGLFHIGAFRRSVYMMSTSTEDVSKSIPLALQRLFYRMQFGDDAPGTKELTRSFGWSDYESFKQHDVQELNRVLMDNLETKMKGTPVQDSEGYIEHLFKGQMENFIRCVNVPFKSSRPEDFYDLSLVVKGLKDIYESIDKYVEVETLEGPNKYQAEGYGLQDANKGIRFLKLPPVLNIQLKRWEMDYVRFQPYKVNDLYMFYPILDMSRYLDRSINQESGIYHLHAVLVHSGGVHGGHYYAYVRPSSNLQWYKFNDSSVSSASEKEAIDDNWGGEEVTRYNRYGKLYTYTYPRSANAYMLIYVRETEAHRYMNDDCSDVIPSHLAQANEEHLCVDLRIATEENLRAHNQTTFDLVNLSEIQPQRHKKTESIEAFKARAAEVFGIPVERQRYWVFQLRKNKTTRPLRSLTARELAEPIQYLRPLQTFYTEYAQMLLLLPDDPDAASGAPRPIGETTEDSEDYLLLFFKLFDPVASSVSYIGHGVFSLATATVAEAEAKFRQLAGDLVPANLKLNIWEEVKPDRIDAVDSALSFKDAGLRIGDVLIFQVETAPQAAPVPYSSPVEWYPYMLERLVVEFRNFNAPEDTASTARFSLECRKSFSYEDVQKVVGEHLEVDPAKIRFTGFAPSTNGPRHVPCERGVGMTLPKMIKWYNDVCPDILYYEILTARLDQIENMKKIKIEFQCANMKSLKLINLLVPKNGVVADIFPILTDQKEVKEVLESDPALGLTFGTKEFRLFEVWNGKMGRSFKARDPVNTSFYEYSIYMVQEMAPEETGSYFDSKLHKWVQVCHFQMGMYQQPFPFGKPFYIVINNSDTASMIKEKIRLRLQLTPEDIATWKLALIANFRAKYLEDTQVAGELHFDDYSGYLGLEHADDTKKSYPVTVAGGATDRPSGGRGGDAGIVIRN